MPNLLQFFIISKLFGELKTCGLMLILSYQIIHIISYGDSIPTYLYIDYRNIQTLLHYHYIIIITADTFSTLKCLDAPCKNRHSM